MRRRAKLLVAALLAVAGAALAFVGSAPQATATVSEALAKGPGDSVELRGSVKEGTVNRTVGGGSFVVTDGARDLLVVWSRSLPEHEAGGSLDGRLVVVKGVLALDDGSVVLHGTDLHVGCASKYETA